MCSFLVGSGFFLGDFCGARVDDSCDFSMENELRISHLSMRMKKRLSDRVEYLFSVQKF